MGLDMYLEKRTYVKNWDHMKPEEKHQVLVRKNGEEVKAIKPERVKEIIEEVGYWRKANAIHHWFITNCSENEDDNGQDIYVSRDDLAKLLDTCKTVKKIAKLVDGKIQNGSRGTKTGWEPIMEDGKYIENPEEVAAILPTQDGFFFGSTDYNEYYMQDVDDTIKMLEEELASPDSASGSYYYNANW